MGKASVSQGMAIERNEWPAAEVDLSVLQCFNLRPRMEQSDIQLADFDFRRSNRLPPQVKAGLDASHLTKIRPIRSTQYNMEVAEFGAPRVRNLVRVKLRSLLFREIALPQGTVTQSSEDILNAALLINSLASHTHYGLARDSEVIRLTCDGYEPTPPLYYDVQSGQRLGDDFAMNNWLTEEYMGRERFLQLHAIVRNGVGIEGYFDATHNRVHTYGNIYFPTQPELGVVYTMHRPIALEKMGDSEFGPKRVRYKAQSGARIISSEIRIPAAHCTDETPIGKMQVGHFGALEVVPTDSGSRELCFLDNQKLLRRRCMADSMLAADGTYRGMLEQIDELAAEMVQEVMGAEIEDMFEGLNFGVLMATRRLLNGLQAATRERRRVTIGNIR